MEMIKPTMLLNKKGNLVQAEEVLAKAKLLAFLFTAAICTQNSEFLPKLSDIRKEGHKRKFGLEVVFVSSDEDETTFLAFFQKLQAACYAIPFGDEKAAELRFTFGVTRIPQLVVVRNKDGEVVTINGITELETKGRNVLVAWECDS